MNHPLLLWGCVAVHMCIPLLQTTPPAPVVELPVPGSQPAATSPPSAVPPRQTVTSIARLVTSYVILLFSIYCTRVHKEII